MTADYDRIIAPAGSLLFAENDVASVAYLIKSGGVEIFVMRDGQEIILAHRGAGDSIGEMAIISAGRRSASARMTVDTELLVITSEQIEHRVAGTDPILRMYLKVVIDRYRETMALLDHKTVNAPSPQEPSPTVSQEYKAAIGTLSMEIELRDGLRRGELDMFFQPIVDLRTYRLAGFEALMRWRHPERGLVSPVEFIPVAEASGLITDLTRWCVNRVGALFPRMLLAALSNVKAVDPLFLSINVSGHDLVHAGFVTNVSDMLAASGIAPSDLKLEVTESVLMKDPETASTTLRACRAIGIKTAIDDFGTGYSSLSHLTTLPITTLKIDRSFVRSMTTEKSSRKIIQMILKLSDELEIPVIAEGIEDDGQAVALTEMGCALGQGYLFAKPMPFDQTIDFIRNWQADRVSAPATAFFPAKALCA